MKIHYFYFCLSLGFIFSCQSKIEVDLLLYQATIYTVDSSFSKVQSIAVSEGKIVAIGTEKDLRSKYWSQSEVDAQGQFVYPGFIDAHCHFTAYAEGLRAVNLFGTKSFEEVVARVVEFQEKNNLEYVTGAGWDQNDWEVKQFPNKYILDSLFPNTPIVLRRVDGHALLANQAALNDSNIKDTTLLGGLVEKHLDGALTGILVDNAMELVKIPEMDKTMMIEAFLEAQENCFAYGLTTLDEAGLEKVQIEFIDSLQKAGLLKMRFYAMVMDSKEAQEYYFQNGKVKTDVLHLNGFKFIADGALGSRGACLLDPYSDHGHEQGFLLSTKEHFRKSAAKLADKGWQMNTHAIGDSANRTMLEIYGEFGKDARWRIEHAQVLNPEDFKLFKQYQVIPSVQPTHATSDMYWADERLGESRLKDSYAYKKLLEQYGKLALGTDFPIEDISTLKTFYAATIRKDSEGYPEDGFQMENALSREEALRGMTIWAAFANFEEQEKGSLEVGKMADFVILNKDWLNCDANEILETKIISTFIAGSEVFGSSSLKK